MSSKVPYELHPITEERREFSESPKILGDFDYLGKNPVTAPMLPDRINYNIDIDNSSQKIAGVVLEVTSTVIGNLIAHPCIVLRRQCQVNRTALRYHLSPFTLVPVLVRLQNRQGLKCLWKGSGGIFILRGCTIAVETFIAELTPYPREVSSTSSIKQLAQHILLKL